VQGIIGSGDNNKNQQLPADTKLAPCIVTIVVISRKTTEGVTLEIVGPEGEFFLVFH
jgi:hypothetical protein